MLWVSLALLLAPGGPAERLSISAVPAEIVAVETEALILAVQAEDASISDLLIAAELGTVEHVEADQSGHFHAHWHVPVDLVPRRVAAAVLDVRERSVSFTTLAVSRYARFRVQSQPGSEIEVALATETLASGRAGADGEVHIRALVPPAVSLELGEPEVERHGSTRRERRRLPRADRLRLWGVLLDPAPMAGAGPATLFLHAYWDSGAALDDATVTVATEGMFRTTPLGSATWRVDLDPLRADRDGAVDARVKATVHVQGESAEFEASVRWNPPPSVAAAVHVEAPPSLRAGERAELVVQVLSAEGEGLERLSVEPVLGGAAYPSGAPCIETRELGGGRYAIGLEAPRALETLALEVRVAPDGPTSSVVEVPIVAGPPARLDLQVGHAVEGEVSIVARVHDVYGNPTSTSRISLSTTAGLMTPDQERDTDTLEARWRPDNPRRSVHVDVLATVQDTDLEAARSFGYHAPPATWKLGGRLGYLTDLGSLRAPSLGIALEIPLFEGVGLVADGSVARAARKTEVTQEAFLGTLERTLWLMPLIVGGQIQLPLSRHGTLRAGGGTGVLISTVSVRALQGDTIAQDVRLWGGHWIASVWSSIAWQLGPGEGLVRIDLIDGFTTSASWQGRPWGVALHLGYLWGGAR